MASQALPHLLDLLKMHATAVVAYGSRPSSASVSTKENISQFATPVMVNSSTTMHDGISTNCAAVGVGVGGGVGEGVSDGCVSRNSGTACSEVGGGSGAEAKAAERLDLLVKLIRLLAHLAISRRVA